MPAPGAIEHAGAPPPPPQYPTPPPKAPSMPPPIGELELRIADPTPHEAGHVEYTCVLILGGSEVHRVVRRFTDFQHVAQKLEQHQKATGGRPPPANTPRAHNFLAGKFNTEWLEERRSQLQAYLDKVWQREDLVVHPDVMHVCGYCEWSTIWADQTITQTDEDWRKHSAASKALLERTDTAARKRERTIVNAGQYGSTAVQLRLLRSCLSSARELRGNASLFEAMVPRFARLVHFISECCDRVEERDVNKVYFSPVEARIRSFLERQAAVRECVESDPAIVSTSFGGPMTVRSEYSRQLKPLIAARDEASEGMLDGATGFRETVERTGVAEWAQEVTGKLLPQTLCERAALGHQWPPEPPAARVPLETPGDSLFGLYTADMMSPRPCHQEPSTIRAQPFDQSATLQAVRAEIAEVRAFLDQDAGVSTDRRASTEDAASRARSALERAAAAALDSYAGAESDDGEEETPVGGVAEQLRLVEVAADSERVHIRRFGERCADVMPELLTRALEGVVQLLLHQAVACSALIDRAEHFGAMLGSTPTAGAQAQKDAQLLSKAEETTERLKGTLLDALDGERRARTMQVRGDGREQARQKLREARQKLQVALAEELERRHNLELEAVSMPELEYLYPVRTAKASNRIQFDFFDVENQLDRGRHVILRTTFNGQKCALKEFNLFSDAARQAFDREAPRFQAMDHPNILPMIAVMTDSDSRKGYMLMPYYEGGNLQRWLQQDGPQAPTFDERLAACTLVLKALFHLHRQGIIHGDIKLENVLVREEEGKETEIVLAEYDVARANDRRQPHVSPDSPIPSFAAPECSDPQCFAGMEADMWAYGCLLMLALVGRLEFLNAEEGCLVSLTDLNSLSSHGMKHDKIESLRDLLTSLFQADPSKRPTSLSVLQHEFFGSSEDNYVTRRLAAVSQARELLKARESFDCGEWEGLGAAIGRHRGALAQAATRRRETGSSVQSEMEAKHGCQVLQVVERAEYDQRLKGAECWESLDAADAQLEESREQLVARFEGVQVKVSELREQATFIWKQANDALQERAGAFPVDWATRGQLPILSPVALEGDLADRLADLLPSRLRATKLLRHENADSWRRFVQKRDALRLVRGVTQLPKLQSKTDNLAAALLATPLDKPLNEKLLLLPVDFNPLPCVDLCALTEQTELGDGLLLREAFPTFAPPTRYILARVVLGRPCLKGRVAFTSQSVPPMAWGPGLLESPYYAPTWSNFDSVASATSSEFEAGSNEFFVCGRRGCYYPEALLECSDSG
eukprot:Hpha_TRINITY_DN16646_c0_g4::TRINITY_DN16646_c0_g4_i1::g.179518::m.179518